MPVAKYGMTSEGSEPSYYRVKDGSTDVIGENEVNRFHVIYPRLSEAMDRKLTKDSGIIFTPLSEKPTSPHTETPAISIFSENKNCRAIY